MKSIDSLQPGTKFIGSMLGAHGCEIPAYDVKAEIVAHHGNHNDKNRTIDLIGMYENGNSFQFGIYRHRESWCFGVNADRFQLKKILH